MNINIRTLFFLSQAAARAMVKQGHGGKIINTASLLSFQGGILVPSYTCLLYTSDPQRNVTKDQTEIYGVGAFLLAGSEVYQLAIRKGAPAKTMTVVNPLVQFRDAVTIRCV